MKHIVLYSYRIKPTTGPEYAFHEFSWRIKEAIAEKIFSSAFEMLLA